MWQLAWSQPVWLEAEGDSRLTGVTDLVIYDAGAGPVLYSTTRGGTGGLSAYLATDTALLRLDTGVLSGTVQVGQESQLLLGTFGDTVALSVTGINRAGLWLYDIGGGGTIPTVGRALPGASLPEDLARAVICDAGGASLLVAAVRSSGLLQSWWIGNDGRLTARPAQSAWLSGHGDSLLALAGATNAGGAFLIALSDGNDILSSYRIGVSGTLVLAGRHRQSDGLGIGEAVALEVIEVAGESYAIVAAQGSGTLSVFRLSDTGRLDPVDHLLDSPDTRFGHVTRLDAATVGEAGYIAASGDEDGVSLFQLLPGGRLLHLATLEDTLTTGLADVSAVSLADFEGGLGLAVASATEPGLTWIHAEFGPVGETVTAPDGDGVFRGTWQGDVLAGSAEGERLIAGDGDDILSDGAGADTLSGGAGADVFVFAADRTMDIITDFQPGTDRLDLSGWTFLRNTGQLTIHTRANGADVAFGDELLRIESQTGQPLTAEQILTGGVLDGDRLLPDWSQLQLSMVAADIGTNGADSLTGSLARDLLEGGAGNDTLMAGGGDDRLDGGPGADHMNGGPGSDVFIVDHAGDRVIESNRWDGHDLIEASVDTWLRSTHVEDLTLTGAADIRGIGNGLSNVITGNRGDNILDGGKNNDTLIGGQGNDTYLVRAPGDTVIEHPGEGLDTVRAYRSLQVPDGIERLYLQGTVPINGIGNGVGNVIVGNMGPNILTGRGGNDTLKGQGGADVFVFDRAPGRGNVDRLVDFTSGEDRLWLKASLFGLPSGGVRSGMLHYGDEATEAHHRVLYDSATGGLRVDPDGTGPRTAYVVFVIENGEVPLPQDLLLF